CGARPTSSTPPRRPRPETARPRTDWEYSYNCDRVECLIPARDNPGHMSASTMSSYFFLVIGAVLVNNVVLVRMLGLCPFMGVSKKLETAVGMGAATTFVLTLGAGSSYLIDRYLLEPNDLGYLRTLCFIVVIAAIVQLTELAIEKTSPLLHRVLGIYLPLITTNCAVLGVPLLNAGMANDFVESLLFGFGSSVGFTLAL